MNTAQLADVFKATVDVTTSTSTVQIIMNLCTSVGADLGLTWLIDSGVTDAQAAMIVRSAIISRFDRITDIISLANARGYLLPDNPVTAINTINAQRQLFAPLVISDQASATITSDAIELSKIAAGYDAGTITFDRSQPASQLASFDFSVDGMSPQSGDALTDILGYQPDADFVKRKRAIGALARLDFSKRKPYFLFTADVITNGKMQNGTIVCWMRMRDASGYNITKRDVFAVQDYPNSSMTNDTLEKNTAALLADNNFNQILSLYDWVNHSDVFAFIDTATVSNTLYSYSVAGVQLRAPSTPFIFTTETTALYLTAAQAADINSSIKDDLKTFGKSPDDIDSISPYPAISQEVYGDPGYSWILAGCNILASRTRGDTADETKTLSYIGAKASDVLAEAAKGRIFIPSDISQIHDAVESSISSYGISQTILSILDGIGVTMFTAGKDDPLGFKPTEDSLDSSTGGLAKILGVIDPQTGTIDPHTLAVAMSVASPSSKGTQYNSIPIASSSSSPFGMINVTDTQQTIPIIPSLDAIIGKDAIDLTTYDGIAKLVGLIRIIYDFYPGSLI